MSNLVSVNWLNSHLNDENLIVLDASIPKITSDNDSKDLDLIPNSLFFDIKHKFSNVDDAFPNAFPSAETFQKDAHTLGINKNSTIVVYDEKGIYSSPRAWWLFKTYGFESVFVLNGGLPKWKKQGFNTVSGYKEANYQGDFEVKFKAENVLFFDAIKKASKDDNTLILDARSSDRFQCKVPEPRKGLRSGTIPNSENLPFQNLLDDGLLKPKHELKASFDGLIKNKNIVFSCGSGITACVLFLAAFELGYKNISVYDGSWTEYGTLVEN